MKIRINGNTIRMRLTPEEVTTLVHSGRIVDSCQFPSAKLSYGVFSTERESIYGDFSNQAIEIFIPSTQLLNWDKDNRVGFEHKFNNDLFVLVEKDFQCLHPRKHENEDHLYPNPTASK